MLLGCQPCREKEDKLIHERKMHQIEEEERVKVLKLKEEKLKAETEKDHAYCLKINQMDDEAFAKYHAEQIAKANDTVIKDAERTKKDAEAEIVKVRLETKRENQPYQRRVPEESRSR